MFPRVVPITTPKGNPNVAIPRANQVLL